MALSLLATPFNVSLITDLVEGPRSLVDLRRKAGSPPHSTMRGHLRTLIEVGVVEKLRPGRLSGAVDYQLTPAGHELLTVTKGLSTWLAASPERPTPLRSRAAKSMIRALIEGWATGMMRALACRPLSLTELSSVIDSTSYPSLERRLSSMRSLGLVEEGQGEGRATPYAVTDWLRAAVAPLAAAARWERRHRPRQAAPITNRDVEAAFLLALPLLRVSERVEGSCRLAVQIDNGARTGKAGAIAWVEEGTVASTGTRLQSSVDAWAQGRTGAWLAAIAERDAGGLELGGEPALAAEIVGGLQGLFGRAIRGAGRELSASAPVSTH